MKRTLSLLAILFALSAPVFAGPATVAPNPGCISGGGTQQVTYLYIVTWWGPVPVIGAYTVTESC